MARIRIKDGPLDDAEWPGSAHGKVILRDGRVGYVTEMTTDQSGPFLKATITAVFLTPPATGKKRTEFDPRRVSALEANFGQATQAAKQMAKSFGLTTAAQWAEQNAVGDYISDEAKARFKNDRLATPTTPKGLVALKRKALELEERICDLRLEESEAKRKGHYDHARRGFWTSNTGTASRQPVFIDSRDLHDMERELSDRKAQAVGLPF